MNKKMYFLLMALNTLFLSTFHNVYSQENDETNNLIKKKSDFLTDKFKNHNKYKMTAVKHLLKQSSFLGPNGLDLSLLIKKQKSVCGNSQNGEDSRYTPFNKETLAKSFTEIHQDLIKRKKDQGHNFSLPEMSGSLDFVAREIKKMQQLDDENNKGKNKELLNQLYKDLQKLKKRNYPYEDSLHHIYKTMIVLKEIRKAGDSSYPKSRIQFDIWRELYRPSMPVRIRMLQSLIDDPAIIAIPLTDEIDSGLEKELQDAGIYSLRIINRMITVEESVQFDIPPVEIFEFDMRQAVESVDRKNIQ